MAEQSEKTFEVVEHTASGGTSKQDSLAVEEPMEIRVVFGEPQKRKGKSLSITMRTPGHDFELATGFLFTEGIVQHRSQISGFEFVGPVAEGQAEANTVRVELAEGFQLETEKLQRHFYTTSSCGVCGKGSLDALHVQGLSPIADDGFSIAPEMIRRLPSQLRQQQDVFDKTGGLHAAGLFNSEGSLVCLREDVGRHNALDKLIGKQLLDEQLPLSRHIVVVSGRASFELLQKCLTASAPILVAVGAPSSLAVDLAREYQMTLIGFASESRFNIYSCEHRIEGNFSPDPA